MHAAFYSVLLHFFICKGARAIYQVQHKATPAEASSKHVAVLELFTSQGCSSCPSADKLVSNYISKKNVFVLSFHVDYWNRYGWQDPFSSREYSQRQENYSKFLKAGIYTPQLVINGQTQMIGSDESRISNSLKKVQSEAKRCSTFYKKINTGKWKDQYKFCRFGQ